MKKNEEKMFSSTKYKILGVLFIIVSYFIINQIFNAEKNLYLQDEFQIKDVNSNTKSKKISKKNKVRSTISYLGDISPKSNEKKADELNIESALSNVELKRRKKIAQARDLIDDGKIYESLDLLKQLLEQNPEDLEALTEIALLYRFDLKNRETAKKFFKKAFLLDGSNRTIVGELISIYEESGQGRDGVEYFKSLQNGEEDKNINFAIGQMLMAQNQPQNALSYLEKGISNDMDEYTIEVLASAYIKSGNEEKALNTYKIAIDQAKSTQANHSSKSSNFFEIQNKMDLLQMKYSILLITERKFDEAEDVLLQLQVRASMDEETISSLFEELEKKKEE